ncbi:MAG: R3H domain-containing nucleic acid-binding protein [Verrucomicrobiota bacterium]
MNQTPRELLTAILGHLGFIVEIEEQERDGHRILQVRTTEPERLIGRRDETLESLQFLVNRILQSRNHGAPRIVVDVEHHRSMRDDSFLHRIHQLAEAVRANGRAVETEPLNSYDRRLVHNAYREDAELETSSPEGIDKIKRVTIRKRD